MKNFAINLMILLWVASSLVSCKKGEPITQAHSFGSLTVELAALPATPVMDVYFNGKLLPDSLTPERTYGLSPKLLLDAGIKAKLAFKKHGTDTLLLDTLITVPSADILHFRLAYSEDLGLKTFLEGSSYVHPDSVKVQIFNNLSSLIPDGIVLDGYLTREHNDGSGLIDDLGILPGLNRKSISKVLVLAAADAGGTPFSYLLRLKDRATGLFIVDASRFKRNFCAFGVDSYKGKNIIVNVGQQMLLGGQTFKADIAVL